MEVDIVQVTERRSEYHERINEKIGKHVCSSHVRTGRGVRDSEGHSERRQETAEDRQGNPEQQAQKRIAGTRDRKVIPSGIQLFIDEVLIR
jgi:hypothetical protein